MKRFLLIPSCALLALGVLTSCQKEDKTAQQLADELTAELQKVTDYKTAEAAAPRVEALNKRFQNASVRVFSVGGNALTSSAPTAYADSVRALAKEIGRVRASKPVTEADGEVDEARLIAGVGVGSGVAPDAALKDRSSKGTSYLRNPDQKNNTPPDLGECYGSGKLVTALSYTADIAEFPMTRFDKDEDVPAIPAAVEVTEEEETPAAEETTAEGSEDAAESGSVAGETTDSTTSDTEETDSTEAADDSSSAASDDSSSSDEAASSDGGAASDDSTTDDSDASSSDDDDDASIDIDL